MRALSTNVSPRRHLGRKASNLLAAATWSALIFISSASLASASSTEQLKKLSIEDLMQVEVTSVLRAPTALSQVPSALQVITSQDIRRSGASSIPEALRLADNLTVARKNNHDWGITARGFNSELANKLLVMIDGRTVYTPLFSGVRWDVQDYLLEDIDRIEVISGPGGSVWGANAVNGVINVSTKSAQDTQGWLVEAGGGNQLREFENVRYGGKLAPNIFFRVYAKYFDRESQSFANGNDAGDTMKLGQGGFRMDADSAAGHFTLQSDYYHGFEGVVGSTDAKVAGGNLVSRWTKNLENDSTLRVQLYYDRAFLRLPFPGGPLGAAGNLQDDLETYDLDIQHNFRPASQHSVVWGVGYRRIEDNSKAAPVFGFDPAVLRQNLFNGFFQDQVSLTDSSLLTVGTRVEHTHYTGLEVEPSIRIQHDLDKNRLVWAAISRAVRTPSRVDRDIRQPSTGPLFFVGNDDFNSETVIAYEIGVRGEVASRIAGSVSAYYNDYQDIRSIAPHPATFLPYSTANDIEGYTYGLELAFNADLTPGWRVHGGYTIMRSDLHVRPGRVDLNNGLAETSDPDYQVNLGSSIDLPGGIEFDTFLRWIGEVTNNLGGQPGTVPAYAELNLRIGLHVSENIELSLIGNNLLHDQHPEFGPPALNRVEIRRSVFGKLTWRF